MKQSIKIFIVDDMKKLFLTINVLILLLYAPQAYANPTQSGITGLITVPSADTLDSGNICIGLWGNISDQNGTKRTIMPASLTLGIGSSWELYGTYPNLLFNGDEDGSGNFALLGSKFRVIGKRNSNFKVAADIYLQKHVSEDITKNNISDAGGRLIASLKSDRIGMHLYGGYLATGGKSYDNEFTYGGGLEWFSSTRTKLTAEVYGKNAVHLFRNDKPAYPLEASLGFQYYFSPHLTFNIGIASGFSEASPDWRVLVGFTTCQGVGTYIKAVPKSVQDAEEKKTIIIKPVKIIPLTSLIKTASSIPPVSKIEVPLEPDKEEIVIKPYGQVVVPARPVSTPIALPVTIQEVPLAKVASEVAGNAEELTASRLDGVTPLYGIDVKGDNIELSLAKSAKLNEKMVVARKFRFPDVMFGFDKADLSDDVKKSLSEVAQQTRVDKKWLYIRIDGHTDSIGSVNYNMDLSIKRAIAIASYLISREGIDPGRIFLKGMGKSKMIAENNTTEGRRMNRRFEILFLVPKEK
jgi:outer membrane protein OmpA-like peptidoglycan-associated protein